MALERRAQWYGTQGTLDKAVIHTLNQRSLKLWPKAVLFLGDPDIPLDNNAVENIIRPSVVSRKNWLNCGSPHGRVPVGRASLQSRWLVGNHPSKVSKNTSRTAR
ncbi:MAG: IS66 family transposase [Turneriella sp.]|nr:IS66 family transposase [Turneriella sp.]